MSAATTKRRALLPVLVTLGALLALTTQTWVQGRADDVLSTGLVTVTGGEASPGVLGLAAVVAAALLGTTTGGRTIRGVSGVALVAAALGEVALVALAVLRPDDTLGGHVAAELARTTAPEAVGAATGWGWAALAAAVLLAIASVRTAVSSRSWAGLSSRYERAGSPAAGPRGEVRSAWDELTDGRDPTLRDDPAP